ncbi:hypothetical protein MMC29_002633 [Sticta canariensis]|nr:hypothetical protein [Sticta canariensis]
MQSSRTDVRRTVLPWYVAVGEDGLTLEVAETDDYEQVGFATMTQKATAVIASGFLDHYGRNSDKLAPSTAVISPTPLGRAIVCQQSWRNLAVIRHADILLGLDRPIFGTQSLTFRRMAVCAFQKPRRGDNTPSLLPGELVDNKNFGRG